MRFNNRVFITTLVVILTITAVAYSLFSYNITLRNDLTDAVCETLSEVTEQQKFNFTSKLSSDISSIKNLAFMTSFISDEKDKVVQTLEKLVKNSNFEYISIANIKGQALVSDGTVLDISNEEYFTSAVAGESTIGSPKRSQIREAVVVPVATPIYTNGSISGVLTGSYTAKKLGDLFLPSFGGKGFVYVTDSQGNILVKPESKYALIVNKYAETNLYTGFDRTEVLDGYETQKEMRNNLSRGKSGHTKITIEGDNEFVSYSSLGINGWNIFVVVPESYIATSASIITGRAALFAIIVIITFVLFLLYTLLMLRRSRKEKEFHTKQLERLAYYDEVTGLPNLAKFKIEVENILAKNTKTRFIMAKIDIVNFRVINEIFGFEAGDKVVVAVAKHIERVRAEKNLKIGAVTRINADEFMLMDISDSNEDEIIKRTELFEDNFNRHISSMLGNHRVEFRYSGYFLEAGETDVTDAIEKTIIAHHIAKSHNSDKICFYDDLFKQRIMRETELKNRMEQAIIQREFKVYLQPKYDLASEKVVGAEALVRWETASGKLVYPNEFIPLFERNGFVVKLDMYMFERTCEIIRGWIDGGKNVVAVSVNFSRAHLSNSNFVAQLEEIANRYSVPKKYLEIELTESTILDNEDVLEKLLNNLHNIGFKLSMDDFGIGYSSLGLLKNLPVDVIKIDRSFFVNNKYKSRARTVIESIMTMTKKLQILTVAEGVESKDHIDMLREVGCDVVQGYYYSKSMPAEEFHEDDRQFVPREEDLKEEIFDMELLGDMDIARVSLGSEMPVVVYRLFQFTLREVINRTYGEGESMEVFRMSGEMAGRAYAKEYIDLSASFNDFISQLKVCLKNSKIGILELEEVDAAANTMVLAVRDDLDCSGTPNLGKTICQYDEGFIAGVLYEYTKKEYAVREVDCWGTGADVCRFHVNIK